MLDCLDRRHPATSAFRGLLVAATHKRIKVQMARSVDRLVNRGVDRDRAVAQVNRHYDSTTLGEARVTPVPDIAVPGIREAASCFPSTFPDFTGSTGTNKQSIPYVSPATAEGREKYERAIDKLCDDYHIGRYHMDPELVQHVLRVDGKMIQFDGCGATQTAVCRCACRGLPHLRFLVP